MKLNTITKSFKIMLIIFIEKIVHKKSWDETLRAVNSYNMKFSQSSSDKPTQISNSTDQNQSSRKSSAVSQDSSFDSYNDMESLENTRKISTGSSAPSSCSS